MADDEDFAIQIDAARMEGFLQIVRRFQGKAWPTSVVHNKHDELDFSDRVKYDQHPFAKGGFSDVHKGTLDNNTEVVVKFCRIPTYNRYNKDHWESGVLRFFREMTVWAELHHVNIVQFVGFITVNGQLGLMSPWYPNGSLVDHLENNPDASKPDLMLDVAEGTEYLHVKAKIIHADLKGMNVLINEHGIACLTDFGISKQMDDVARHTGFTTTASAGGTTYWMAPEVLLGSRPDYRSDVYSCGGVFLEICSGNFPFHYLAKKRAVRSISADAIPRRSEYPELTGKDSWWELFCQCWDPDVNRRPTITDVVQTLYRMFRLKPRINSINPLRLRARPATPQFPSPSFPYRADPKYRASPDIIAIRDACPRIRILIIGPPDAGKTTVLKAMCNPLGTPTIRNLNGEKIVPSKRDNLITSDYGIETEYTSLDHVDFVFHEVRLAEWLKRPDKSNLLAQVHCIWYCIPLDKNEVILEEYLAFFDDNSLSPVPVIAILTKSDMLVDKSLDRLAQDGIPLPEAMEEAARRAEDHLDSIYQTDYPPKSHVILGGINKGGTGCAELSEKVARALGDTIVRKLFVSSQRHSLAMCMKYAVDEYVNIDDFSGNRQAEDLVTDTLCWFPLTQVGFKYRGGGDDEVYYVGYERVVYGGVVVYYRKRYEPPFGGLKSIVSLLCKLSDAVDPFLRECNVIIATAIIAHRSFSVDGSLVTAFQAAYNEYLASPQLHDVAKAIETLFRDKHPFLQTAESPNADKTSQILMEICQNHLLG